MLLECYKPRACDFSRRWICPNTLRPVRTEQFDPDLTGSAASALAIESRLIQIELDGFKPVSNQFDPVYTSADRPLVPRNRHLTIT